MPIIVRRSIRYRSVPRSTTPASRSPTRPVTSAAAPLTLPIVPRERRARSPPPLSVSLRNKLEAEERPGSGILQNSVSMSALTPVRRDPARIQDDHSLLTEAPLMVSVDFEVFGETQGNKFPLLISSFTQSHCSHSPWTLSLCLLFSSINSLFSLKHFHLSSTLSLGCEPIFSSYVNSLPSFLLLSPSSTSPLVASGTYFLKVSTHSLPSPQCAITLLIVSSCFPSTLAHSPHAVRSWDVRKTRP